MTNAIAITGIGCRFPGGVFGPESFWRLLCAGTDAITEVPVDRWQASRFYNPEPGVPGKTYARWGGFVEGIDRFDPQFFGISPREAAAIDPQQRLLLETAWEALEDAGHVLDLALGSDVGVFVGISHHDYSHLQAGGDRLGIGVHTPTGTAQSIAANRISYCFNLRGPSFAVDTACSSALTAVHLACESLLSGECQLALAGGVNLLISPDGYIGFSQSGMLSPDGRCRAFDAGANGFVRAEGAGVVVLKPLPAALADGDHIYAVIRGTATNQDGHTNGLMVPSQTAQADLVRVACQNAGVEPSEIDYVEAHGTGTPVGDPIEAQALAAALGQDRPVDQPCVVGSVKTNIGHLESAAGIAGLIKVALMLERGLIPPNLHFDTPHPKIPLQELKLRIPDSLEPFVGKGAKRLAGVNSFGFGGANAHAVLEEPPRTGEKTESPVSATDAAARLLTLSAQSAAALNALATSWQPFLSESNGSPDAWRDIAYTASVRRNHHDHRLAIVAGSGEEAAQRLSDYLQGEERPGMSAGQRARGEGHKIAFVFSGQGPQWWAMGRELMATEPVFRDKIVACDALFRQLGNWSLCEELAHDEAHCRLHETAIAQPAIFAIQVALAALWESWSVRPSAAIGHSVGEVAAAHVAGALDLADAARVVFHRGRSMQDHSGKGKMLAAALSPEEAELLRAGRETQVFIAAVNGPASVTLSGDPAALESVREAIDARGVICRFVPVEYAFHSPYMETAACRVVNLLEGLAAHAASIPIASTVTGWLTDGSQFTADYWGESVRRPVQFAPAIDELIHEGYETFVEISPHPVLAGDISACLAKHQRKGTILASLRRKEPERAMMLATLGALFTRGFPVEWNKLYPVGGRCVRLPSYPWQWGSYWSEVEESRQVRLAPAPHPLLGDTVGTADPCWKNRLNLKLLPYLQDHRVQSHLVFPAAAYIEMALAAAREVAGRDACALEDVEFQQALLIPEEGDELSLQLSYSVEDRQFAIASRIGGPSRSWLRNCRGTIRENAASASASAPPGKQQPEGYEDYSVSQHYERRREIGLEFGPAFQPLRKMWRKPPRAESRVELAQEQAQEIDRYLVHPALLDGCFQTLSAAIPDLPDGRRRPLLVPARIERIRFFSRPPSQVWVKAHHRKSSAKFEEGDLEVFDEAGNLLLEIKGLRCQTVDSGRRTGSPLDEWLYELQWQLLPQQDAAPLSANYLPSGQQLHDHVREQAAQSISQLGWQDRYSEVAPQLTELCRGYILQAFAQLGWKPRVGERFSTIALMQRLGIAEKYARLLPRYLSLLAAGGVLKDRGENWEVVSPDVPTDLAALWQSILSAFPSFHPDLSLIGRCGQNLAAILRGDLDPLQIIFANNSLNTLEHLYSEGWSLATYNRMMADAVSLALARLPEGRRIRILEIGAGTGGLTSHLLPRLSADRVEYVFTDVSKLFCSRAEQRFRDCPFLRCETLDIESSPSEQGFPSHGFDLIVASDMLHAVASLRPALDHVRELLSSEGMFLFLEVVKPFVWLDLVFGLTEGWWRFRDTDLRAAYPLLSRSRWQSLLAETGFRDVTSISAPNEPEDTEHVIFAARLRRLPAPTVAASTAPAPGRWLIFADQHGIAERLAARLEHQGEQVVLAVPAAAPRKLDARRIELRPDVVEDIQFALTQCSDGKPWHGIVHLGSLLADGAEPTTADTLDAAQRSGCYSVLALVQALADGVQNPPPRLSLVTSGAQPAGTTVHPLVVAQSPLCGLARVLGNEHPELQCRLIDLSPTCSEEEIASLVRELRLDDGETEIALRHEARYAQRLVRKPWSAFRGTAPSSLARMTPGTKEPFRLRLSRPGVMENLDWVADARRAPGPGEVEIEVAAAALNFRDVMKTLGIYPTEADDALVLGDECVGRIVAVGEGVQGLRQGDEVISLGSGCFGSHVTTSAAFVLPKPSHLSSEEAATIPVCYLTALYALSHIGRIAAGERVLIHAAAGGVGLAAVHVARHFGAEVFATAGSPEKREFLKLMGVQHVFDSRSLDFAEQVLEATAGEGVDLVLNSLAGDAIAKGLAILRPYGRFLELGKRDIYQNSRLGLAPMRNNLTFAAIDLGQAMAARPELVRSMLRELQPLLESRSLPPLPLRAFPARDVRGAFRLMAQARHLGKLVVTLGELNEPPLRIPSDLPPRFAAEATYLITGGLGGFGLAVAEWMAGRGARHFVLASRSGIPGPSDVPALRKLEATGARVVTMCADVSREADVARVLSEISRSLPPLRGVLHAAMVLDDGSLRQLDAERFARVLAPKMRGAWNLHLQTQALPLDFFVMFSSAATTVGNPGQGNYAAANAFLDALAHHRRASGLPVLAIDWGLIAEVGYVSRRPKVEEFLVREGLLGFTPAQATEILGRLLGTDAAQVVALHVDWKKRAEFFPRMYNAPRYERIFAEHADAAEVESQGAVPAVRDALLAAASAERLPLVAAFLQTQAAGVLRIPAAEIDLARPLSELGLDSLMAVELMNRIEAGLQLPVRPGRLLLVAGLTIPAMAQEVLEMVSESAPSLLEAPSQTPLTEAAQASPPESEDRLGRMSVAAS